MRSDAPLTTLPLPTFLHFTRRDRQFKSRKGTLVGEDHLGNKYYENMAYQSGRHRWVEYKDLDGGWSTYNASSIPPEWHGWLNHVDDKPGLTDSKEPIYAVKMIGPANSGEPDMYQPKGSFLNKQGIKNWKRYTAWTPP